MTTGKTKRYDPVAAPSCVHLDGSITCARLPVPWSCSRDPGHEGPCAATRDPRVSLQAEQAEFKDYTDSLPMFSLYKEQREAAREWIQRHDGERHISPGKKYRYSGSIGGAYTWEFTPTSIGMAVVVKCSCGEELNISDYENW